MRSTGDGMPARCSSAIAFSRACASREAAVAHQHLDDLLADGVARIERGHRLLEDHREAVAAQIAQLAVRQDRAARCRRRSPRRTLRRVALGSRPITASEVTLLPQPDSPTSPSVEPRASGEIDAVDRDRAAARDRRGTRTRRFSIASSGAAITSPRRARRRCRASSSARSMIADGIALARQELREVHPALAAHRFEALKLGERIGVIVDAKVEIGPFLLAVDQQRRRLLAALVAAGGLAGLQRGDQAARKRQRGVRRVGLRGLVRSPRAPPACCRRPRTPRPPSSRTSRCSPCRYARRCGRPRPSHEAGGVRGRRRRR